MRKAQKQQAEELLRQLVEAHDQIKKFIEGGSVPSAMDLLEECQKGGIALGTLIENTEGESHPTVLLLEEYCELTYQIHENLLINKEMTVNKIYKLLRQKLIKISNSLRNDIRIRLEIAFFPYKASMWDSLESVYLAAKEDPDCDAYCVPIPYYDMNPDHSFGMMHYEGDKYPQDIEVVDWTSYNFEERKPDVIYIHNIYDNCNLVTSVHPRYYSGNLRQYTERLIYIPYYMTSGGMSEAQRFCPSYLNADYIVIQSPKFRDCFDARIPDSKFLPFGSPKADRVIRKCQNPPVPPEEWQGKMSGKKVYFYNTSISGMLADTENFLKKMEYVFRCFEEHKNACVLWRPHPLLEATFHSMRSEYEHKFEKIKKIFMENGIGILDTTADIEVSIALSDAYIGDAGTSVTALFGVAGKPVFLLDNRINRLPTEDDVRESVIKGFTDDGNDMWIIAQGNQLYYSPNDDYHYEWYCDLPQSQSANYYLRAIEIDGKVYVCPRKGTDIYIVKNHAVIKSIPLADSAVKTNAPYFKYAWNIGHYLILVSYLYPAIVRYDIQNDKLDYLEGYNDIFVQRIQDRVRTSESCIWGKYLMIPSPTDNRILAVDSDTMETQIHTVREGISNGCFAMASAGDEMWLLPYGGMSVTRWNPATGITRIYSNMPENLRWDNTDKRPEDERIAFSGLAVCDGNIFLTPAHTNIFVKIDIGTGISEEWLFPIKVNGIEKANDSSTSILGYIYRAAVSGKERYCFFQSSGGKLYELNLDTNDYYEIPVVFSKEELQAHERGFGELGKGIVYGCRESALNMLPDFLDGMIHGNAFSEEKQRAAYQTITANCDGSCGEMIHGFVTKRCR